MIWVATELAQAERFLVDGFRGAADAAILGHRVATAGGLRSQDECGFGAWSKGLSNRRLSRKLKIGAEPMRGLAIVFAMLILALVPRLSAEPFRRGGVIVPTNSTPGLRGVGAQYFGILKQSQVWMNVQPTPQTGEPASTILNITVAFPGVQLDRVPPTVQVRADAICSVFPLRIRRPLFTFTVDGGTIVDLASSSSRYQLLANCSKRGGGFDAIVTEVPFRLLRRLAESKDVTVNALGFFGRLAPADLTAWRVFIHTIERGVTIRPAWSEK
jgi:hypothetical protein